MTGSMKRIVGLLGGALATAVLVTGASSNPIQGNGNGHGNGHGGGGGGGGGSTLPDSPNIAYVDLNGDEHEIVLFDTLTGASGVLVPEARAALLAWSPDGTELAYYKAGASREIRVAATDGSGADRLVVPTGGGIYGLDWTRSPAPNGRSMLVFGDSANGGPAPARCLWAVAPDGTELTLLAVGYTDPRWSPDGNHIVAKAAGASVYATPLVVLTIGLDSSAQLVVTDNRSITMVPENAVGPTYPIFGDWSNDGQWVVALAIDASTYDGDLWRIDPFDASVAVRLTQGHDWEESPGFGPLDQRIYFKGDGIHGNRKELFSIDAVTGGDWVLESGRSQKHVGMPRARRDVP